jgi:S1-C subfamily serine protease
MDGKQIGVNTARFTGSQGAQNENYAVSVARVLEILDTLKAGRSPKWIGATLDELVDLDTGEPFGLGIRDVTPGGPAEQVGLEGAIGDDYRHAVIGVNGEEIVTLQDYCDAIPEEGPATLQIGIFENGEVVDVDIVVGSGE